jgi:urea transporter
MSLRAQIFAEAELLLDAYGAVIFSRRRAAALLCLAATWLEPNIGATGLLTALAARAWLAAFRFAPADPRVPLCNALLTGLLLGAMFRLDAPLLPVAGLAALLCVSVSAWSAPLLQRWERLPILSLPFLIVALLLTLATPHWGALTPLGLTRDISSAVTLPATGFLSAMGGIFFLPSPLAGALVYTALVLTSPWLAALAAIGFVVGAGLVLLLTGEPAPSLIPLAGFNFVLTAIAVGGVFVVPGRAALVLAAAATAVAALLSAAFQPLFAVWGLPVLTLPFLAATLGALATLRHRAPGALPWLVLERPDLPERTWERAAVAQARTGDPDSTPLAAPVIGNWDIYQGFDDRHTHQGTWRHALDFYVAHGGRSFTGSGNELADYFCFDLPVVAPADGWVVTARSDLPDQRPGQMDLIHNWGNHVILRLTDGRHVMLAHLRQESVRVKPGDWVTLGSELARCGSSGRSPQPHLHMQVQAGPDPGAPTLPFHLTSVILFRGRTPRYWPALRPGRGDTVRGVARDPRLACALHLPVGRELHFSLTRGARPARLERLQVRAGLDGLRRLHGRGDARLALLEYPGVLAGFDREGRSDPLLDLWLLALGLTPLAESPLAWRDRLPVRLLPLPLAQRLWLRLCRPLGALTWSDYRREWDPTLGQWRQRGHHLLPCGEQRIAASTEAIIDPERGVVRLSLRCGDKEWRAELQARGLAGDDGIPGWSEALRPVEPA